MRDIRVMHVCKKDFLFGKYVEACTPLSPFLRGGGEILYSLSCYPKLSSFVGIILDLILKSIYPE